MSYSPIKSVPYYSTFISSSDQTLAKSLRDDFAPTIKRLLPVYHLGRVAHSSLREFAKKHTSKYPYFFKNLNNNQ